MATAYVLYNKMAENAESLEVIKMLEIIIDDQIKYIDFANISDYHVFLTGLEKNDYVILAGGDGTLNQFVNNIEGVPFNNEILYFPNGVINGFANDLGYIKESNPFSIKNYVKEFPYITIHGKTYRFVNGIGFGATAKNPFSHKTAATVKITADGKTTSYQKVWCIMTLNGCSYGDMVFSLHRNQTNNLSTIIFHNCGKLKAFLLLPKFFKRKHKLPTKHIDILYGSEITVEFETPVSIEMDGEVISNVSSYTTKLPIL